MSLNLAECVAEPARKAPGRTALVFDHHRLTYGELAARVQQVANFLKEKSLGQSFTAALMVSNTPWFPIIYYGILWAGGTVVTMNPALRRREILKIVADSGARIVFVEEGAVPEAAKALRELPRPIHRVLVDTPEKPGDASFGESIHAILAGAWSACDLAQRSPDDVAAILYSYGVPEQTCGAELTHFNLFHNALACKDYALGYGPEDVCLTVLPLFHGFGQTTMMNTPFMAQSTVVLCPRFEAHYVLELIAREKVTILAMVPAMFQLLNACKKGHEADFSSVRVAAVGGAAMPVEVAQRFMDRFGVPVVEGYGLTETSPVVAFNHPAMNRLGTLGKPVWGTEVRILRPDGSWAHPGETGEIVVRGHNIMKQYHNQPAATAKAMAGGWFHTRDLGYFDPDGFLHFAGLAKNLVITSGMNVSPAEVEGVLSEHPGVQEAAVFGIPDALRGESIAACVVARAGQTLVEKELVAYCRDQLSAYKCPRHWKIMEALPRDASGAILKEPLRAGMQS